MESVMKAFLGVFFLLALVYTGIGLTGASIEARNADTCAAQYASRIGNSNYSEIVTDACVRDAEARGYGLTVNLVKQKDRRFATYGTLDLRYHYRIPLLSLDQEKTVTADIL